MACIGRRLYFTAPQCRAGTHVLSHHFSRSGWRGEGELSSPAQITKRGVANDANGREECKGEKNKNERQRGVKREERETERGRKDDAWIELKAVLSRKS